LGHRNTEPSGQAQAVRYVELGWLIYPDTWIVERDGLRVCSCPLGAACSSPGKHPFAKLAPHGPQSASSSPALVKQWWSTCPLAHIAVVCGLVSGIWVLDIDKGSGGIESLRRLMVEHGWDESGWLDVSATSDSAKIEEFYLAAAAWFATAAVLTGGGGLHLYFRWHADTKGKSVAGAFVALGLPGIDIRADGTHVVAPPSGHISGGTYRWLFEPWGAQRWGPHAWSHLESAREEDRHGGEGPIKCAPEWLLEMLCDPRCGKRIIDEQEGVRTSPASRYESYELPPVIAIGTRDDELTRYAGSLRGKGYEKDAILEALTEANGRCDAPLAYADLKRIASSISRKPKGSGIEKPPRVGEPLPTAELERRRAEAGPELPGVWAPDPPSVAPMKESDRREVHQEFTFLSFGQVLKLPPKEYLIPGVLGKGDQAALVGGSKQGKTLVVLDMAAALVRGQSCLFADRFPVKDAIRICYATGEGQSGIPNRFAALQHKHQFTPEQWARFLYCDKVPNLFRPDSPRWMEVFARGFQDAHGSDALAGGLLIIDTYARAIAGGNENSAQDTTIVQDALGDLQNRLKCTLLTLLHTPHGLDRIRGSTNIQASFDSILKVREDSGSRYFGPDVSKDSGDFEEAPYGVRVHSYDDERGEEHKGAYIEWLEGTSTKSAPKAKDKKTRASAEISRLLQERAQGEYAAVSVATIHDWIQGFVTSGVIREILHDLSMNPASVFRAKQVPSIDKNGHANKKAWHYWTEVEGA
jgi:hypothetical protein